MSLIILYCIGDHLTMIVSGLVIILQIAVSLRAQEEAEAQWNYKEQDKWPASCRGNLQSPIALDSDETLPLLVPDLQFGENYFQEYPATVTNTGHTVEIRLINAAPLTISGGGLAGQYILDAFHFHWDAEHTIDEYRYPLEGHFVHFAAKHGNLSNALKFPGGVAVLAVFYKTSFYPNPAFDGIVEAMPLVAHNPEEPAEIEETIEVSDFFPENTDHFYRYNGSLTTPGCNEVVIWTLFDELSWISKEQLSILSQIWDENNELLVKNFRALQNRNGRNVYYKYDSWFHK